LWLPHFTGAGTPEADWDSRAAMVGARLEDTTADLGRGLLESLAFWLRHNLVEMERLSGVTPIQLILLGGANQQPLMGRLKAAANQALFFPIWPGLEEGSLICFYNEAVDKFTGEIYTGPYEAGLVAEFEKLLPPRLKQPDFLVVLRAGGMLYR